MTEKQLFEIFNKPHLKEHEHIVKPFKDGVTDGFFEGNINEEAYTNGFTEALGIQRHFYKQGYDFGVAMYCNTLPGEEECN